MNFFLRHEPISTFDVDIWIEDSDENRNKCEQALAALDAEWGESDANWEPVRQKPHGWLARQAVFSLLSPHGAIDVFRYVQGLPNWHQSRLAAVPESTAQGVSYHGLSDEDMLKCQLALDTSSQNATRVQKLRARLGLQP